MKYNRNLIQAILWDRIDVANVVNAEVISLKKARAGHGVFNSSVAKKFVIDPHCLLKAALQLMPPAESRTIRLFPSAVTVVIAYAFVGLRRICNLGADHYVDHITSAINNKGGSRA